MSCVAHPGGKSGKVCLQDSAFGKYGLLTAVRCMHTGGKSLLGITEKLKVSALLLLKWKAQKISEMDPCDELFNSKKRASHTGSHGQFAMIKASWQQSRNPCSTLSLSWTIRESLSICSLSHWGHPSSCQSSTKSLSPHDAVRRWLVAHSRGIKWAHTLHSLGCAFWPDSGGFQLWQILAKSLSRNGIAAFDLPKWAPKMKPESLLVLL